MRKGGKQNQAMHAVSPALELSKCGDEQTHSRCCGITSSGCIPGAVGQWNDPTALGWVVWPQCCGIKTTTMGLEYPLCPFHMLRRGGKEACCLIQNFATGYIKSVCSH